MNKSSVLFFKEVTVDSTSDNLENYNFGNSLKINVSGTATSFVLEIKGIVDLDNSEYTTLAIINASDFEILNQIKAKGIYIADVSATRKIRAEIKNIVGGNVNVYGVITD